MDRAISPTEVKIVNWLLDHALVDVAAYRHHAVEELRVMSWCSCGCCSLDFEPEEKQGKSQMLADVIAAYPDGQRAGLILWGRDGKIILLEVYDFEPGSSHRVPDVCNLCTWEELGLRQTSVSWGQQEPRT